MQTANLLDWLQNLQVIAALRSAMLIFFTSSWWAEIWYNVRVGISMSVLIKIPESDSFRGSEAGLKY